MGKPWQPPAEKIGLASGGDSKGMTPFDTEPEFWYFLLHAVTLGDHTVSLGDAPLSFKHFKITLRMKLLPWHCPM